MHIFTHTHTHIRKWNYTCGYELSHWQDVSPFLVNVELKYLIFSYMICVFPFLYINSFQPQIYKDISLYFLLKVVKFYNIFLSGSYNSVVRFIPRFHNNFIVSL